MIHRQGVQRSSQWALGDDAAGSEAPRVASIALHCDVCMDCGAWVVALAQGVLRVSRMHVM